MKKILFTLALFLAIHFLYGQVPEIFNYQGVLRNSSNELVVNTDIRVQASLFEGSTTSTSVYSETHDVQTNNYGQFAIQIGNGTSSIGNFSTIDWASGQAYLKLEVDENGGDNFTELPVVHLLTVPYALYAKDVANKDDADPDATNEIQDISLSGTDLSISSGSTVDLSIIQDGVDDADNNPNNEIQGLILDGDTLEISDGNKVVLPYDSSRWANNGDKLYYNTGNVGIGSTDPVSNLEVKATSSGTDALFQVINSTNDTVFAVYPDGVKIFINADAKGKVGGFAVSGRTPSKATGVDILKVTVDSTRIYVSDTISTKGKVGGFAVSGRSPSKGTTNDYLQVTRDSTRVYITDDATKGKVGGFAVSGRSPSKAGIEKDYFNISANITAEKINNESRIMWYPSKSALLAGELNVPNSDSVGQYSISLGYRNTAKGDWSQAMGYQSIARGPYSTAIGFESVADTNSFAFGTGSNALGKNSFAFGAKGVDELGNVLTTITSAIGDYSFAFGLGSTSSGLGSFVMGANSTASGDFSTAFGFNTVATGLHSMVMGANSAASGDSSIALGFNTDATGVYSMAMGVNNTSGGRASFTMGSNNIASGNRSLAMGENNEAQGVESVAFGRGNLAQGQQSMVAGSNNTAEGVTAVAFGSGNNAIGDGTFITGQSNSCTQTAASAIGIGNTASAAYALATGSGTHAAGQGSISAGQLTTASGDNSLAIGYGTETTANGDNAFAAGLNTIALGYGSIASGESTQAVGKYSLALGYNTIAPSYGCVVIGKWNETTSGNATSWNPPNSSTEPVFIIGNGLNGGGFENDALIVYQNGNMKIDGDFYPASDDIYDLGTPGARWQDIYTNGAVTTSDMRLKSNISNINYGLNELLKLRPVTFQWKDKPRKGMRLGLIAQEVLPIINEVINVGDDENQTLGIRYSDIIPVLIKSIQEQQKIIEEQKNKNIDLENRLIELEKLLKKE